MARAVYRLERRHAVPGYPGVEVGYSRLYRRWCLARAGHVLASRRAYTFRTAGKRADLSVHRAMCLAGVSVVDGERLAEQRARPIPGWPDGPPSLSRYRLCDGDDGQPIIRSWQPGARNLPGSVLAPVPHPWDGRPMLSLVGDDGARYGRQIGFFVLCADVGPPPEGLDWVLHGENGALDNRVGNLRWGDREQNWLDMDMRGILRDQAGHFRKESEEEAAWWAGFEDVA